eukprot:1022023-Pelagomonas_calceolata.AAC.3
MQQAQHLTEGQHSYPQIASSTECKPVARLNEIKSCEDTRPGRQMEAASRQHTDLCKNNSGGKKEKRKEKSTPAKRPRALRKGSLTSKLESGGKILRERACKFV